MTKNSINWTKRSREKAAASAQCAKPAVRKTGASGNAPAVAVKAPADVLNASKRAEPAVKAAGKARNRGIAGEALRRMVILAMLVAMEIVLNRFLSINTAGWKIGFAFIPPIIAAILFGPIESAIVYALSDFIGAMLFPFGPYHPGFTVCAAVMGVVAGFFLNERPFEAFGGTFEWKRIRFFRNILPPVVINCVLIGLVVNTVWVAMLYGSRTYWGWFLYRLPEYGVMVPVQLLLIPALLKLSELLKKTGIFKKYSHSKAKTAKAVR